MPGVKLAPNQKEMYNKAEDNADNIQESSTRKWMTSAEKTQLSTNTSDIYTLQNTRNINKTLDGDGTSGNPFQLNDEVALDLDESYKYTNGTSPYSNDETGIENRSHQNLSSWSTSDTNRYGVEIEKYVAVSISTGYIVLYDKFTKQEIDRVNVGTFGPITKGSESVIMLDGTDIYYYSVPALTLLNSVSVAKSTNDCDTGKTSGYLYGINTTGTTLQRYNTSGVYDDGGLLPSISNVVCALLISDDEDTAYVIDAPASSAGDVYFRVYDISTLSSPSLTGSVQLTSTVNGEQYAKLGWNNGLIVAKTTNGQGEYVTNLKMIDITTPASPAIAFQSTNNSLSAYSCCFGNGVIYRFGTTTTNYIDQIPNLTRIEPNFIESLGGGGLYSADGVLDASGNLKVVSKADIVKAASGDVLDHASSHETGGSDTINPGNMSGAQSTGEVLEITNAEYGTDSFKIENRDLTLLKTSQIANQGYSFNAVNQKYIAAVDDTTTDLYVFDRTTGVLIKTITGIVANTPIVFISDDTLVQLSNNLVKTINVVTETLTNRNTAGAIDGAYGLAYSDGLLTWITLNNIALSYMDIDTWTLTNNTPSTTPSNHAFAHYSDGTSLWVLDADTSSATSYIRKYTIANGTMTDVSSGFTTDKGDFSTISIIDGKLFVTVDNGSTAGDMTVRIYDPTDLTIAPTIFTTETTCEYSSIFERELITLKYVDGTYYEIAYVQLPALTQMEPDFVDSRGGDGVYSTDTIKDAAGNEVQVTKSDIVDVAWRGQKLEDRDLTLLKTGETISSDVVSLSTFAACDRGFYTNLNTSNTIYRFDRSTGQLLSQTTGTYNNRAIACVPAGLVHIENNTYKLLSDDLSTILDTGSMTSDTLANVALACRYSKHDGLIHIVTYDEIYYQIDPTTWVSTSIRSLTEMAANAYSLDADATYLYTSEISTGSAIYIRKFNVSDGVSQATSASFGTATADTSVAIDASNSSLLIIVVGKKVYHLLKSDLSIVWSGAASADIFGGAIIDGILYGMLENGSDVDFKAYQLPALTLDHPAFDDRSNTEGILSTPSVIDSDGNSVIVTNSDIVRKIIDIQPLIQNQFGAVVESVETSEPGSPVVGKYYLMDSTSTWYPNTVAYYDVRGWHIYQPYHGAKIRDASGQYTYEYYTDRWVKKVDMMMYATVTGDGSTTITDIMTLDEGDTTIPTLVDGEAWNIEVELLAVLTNNGPALAATTFKWTLDVALQQGGGTTVSTINGVSSAQSMTAVGTPNALYETPTIDLDLASLTGQFRITVGVNSAAASGNIYKFYAIVTGSVHTGIAVNGE